MDAAARRRLVHRIALAIVIMLAIVFFWDLLREQPLEKQITAVQLQLAEIEHNFFMRAYGRKVVVDQAFINAALAQDDNLRRALQRPDPWGRCFRLHIESVPAADPKLPPTNTVRASSAGPDGKFDTADDVRSDQGLDF